MFLYSPLLLQVEFSQLFYLFLFGSPWCTAFSSKFCSFQMNLRGITAAMCPVFSLLAVRIYHWNICCAIRIVKLYMMTLDPFIRRAPRLQKCFEVSHCHIHSFIPQQIKKVFSTCSQILSFYFQAIKPVLKVLLFNIQILQQCLTILDQLATFSF